MEAQEAEHRAEVGGALKRPCRVRDLCLAASQLILEFIAAQNLLRLRLGLGFGLVCHCSDSRSVSLHICRHNKERGTARLLRHFVYVQSAANQLQLQLQLDSCQCPKRTAATWSTRNSQLATGCQTRCKHAPRNLPSDFRNVYPMYQVQNKKVHRVAVQKVAAADAESRMLFSLQTIGISCQHNWRACNSRVACHCTWHINTLLPGISLPQADRHRRQKEEDTQTDRGNSCYVLGSSFTGVI